jgi:hypothetical protein
MALRSDRTEAREDHGIDVAAALLRGLGAEDPRFAAEQAAIRGLAVEPGQSQPCQAAGPLAGFRAKDSRSGLSEARSRSHPEECGQVAKSRQNCFLRSFLCLVPLCHLLRLGQLLLLPMEPGLYLGHNNIITVEPVNTSR